MIVTNGDFSSWSGDNPVGWGITENPPDTEVSEVGAGEGHGGSGTGYCNIYSSTAAQTRILQTVNKFVIGKTYRLSINIDTIVAGGITVLDNSGHFNYSYNTPGVKTFTFVATTTSFSLRVQRYGVCDVTFDDLSIKLYKSIGNLSARPDKEVVAVL